MNWIPERKCCFCGIEGEDNNENILIGDDNRNVYICKNCWLKIGALLQQTSSERTQRNTISALMQGMPFGKAQTQAESELPAINWSDLHPEKIKEYLDHRIIGQEQAKKILSVAVYNHYKMLDYAAKHKDDQKKVTIGKSNILMIGPTGVGKTALIQALADVLQVPFAITDATTLTENGYVGADPESCIQRLLRAADGDIARAETGIVYIDEIDKLACKGENMSITRDVSGEGVQQALLKIIEGTRVDLQPNGMRRHPEAETVEIDTSRILFIVGGAFVGIDNFICSRVNTPAVEKTLGFCMERPNSLKETKLSFNELIDRVAQEDFRNYGIIPELLGRLPVIAPLHELGTGELCRILTEPQNALVKQYQEVFRCDDVNLRFSDGALQAIADRAIQNGTGARGLRTIMENVLLDRMYTIKRNAKGQEILITKREIDKAFAQSTRRISLQKTLAG